MTTISFDYKALAAACIHTYEETSTKHRRPSPEPRTQVKHEGKPGVIGVGDENSGAPYLLLKLIRNGQQ